jgi:hypothetical protein
LTLAMLDRAIIVTVGGASEGRKVRAGGFAGRVSKSADR